MSHSQRFPYDLKPTLASAVHELNEDERWWVERCIFLESRGYRLRPRFRPGWVPSWKDTGQDPMHCEDARFHMIRSVMDATRLSDGRPVVLKVVSRGGDEVKIISMLSSPEALEDPTNHCVPLFDHFGYPNNYGPDFLVMPLLHKFDDPNFHNLSEILDFVQQTLEGLVYIHRRGVAHRDLSGPNILMDATALYPDGVHPDPYWSYLLPDKLITAKSLKRSEVKNFRYYFIDFGISSYFEDPFMPRLVTGIDGLDRDVPERHLNRPYNPFAVDAFSLGNTYKKLFNSYRNPNLLSPLVEEMMDRDPEERPTAEEALAMFHELVKEIPQASLIKTLRHVNEPFLAHYLRVLPSSLKSFGLTLRGIFSKRYATLATIPLGISAFIFLRNNQPVFGRIRNFFLGVHRTGI